MATLQISFYGPFFYDFRPTAQNKVNIYAPRCPGHKAGIFSAKLDQPLYGRHRHGDGLIYVLDGDVFSTTNTPPPILISPQSAAILDVSKYASPAFSDANFCIQVPYPQYVYGLNGSPSLEIVQGTKPQGAVNTYATALRFYYQADLTKPLALSDPSGQIATFDFDPIPPPPVTELLRNSDVVVRYDSDTPEDSEHEDAKSCFDLIAGLGTLDWWLCYEDTQYPPGGSGSFVRTGDDCLAPIMVLVS
ncbi:MAG TPA: hypothetical protein VI636_02320 [Candidatus Angelobacter sp.]